MVQRRSIKAVLKKARKMIENRDHWTQRLYSRPPLNNSGPYRHCAVGAIYDVEGATLDVQEAALRAVQAAAHLRYGTDLVAVNDGGAHKTTGGAHRGTLLLFDDAIAELGG